MKIETCIVLFKTFNLKRTTYNFKTEKRGSYKNSYPAFLFYKCLFIADGLCLCGLFYGIVNNLLYGSAGI